MSHLVSPSAYRLGRTQLWGNVNAAILENVLWRNYLAYPLGLIIRGPSTTLYESAYLLYYPILSIYRYRKRFLYPRFYRHLGFLSMVLLGVTTEVAASTLSAIWKRTLYRFTNRFTIRRKRLDWQSWFRISIIRGVGLTSLSPAAVTCAEYSVMGSVNLKPGRGFLNLRSVLLQVSPVIRTGPVLEKLHTLFGSRDPGFRHEWTTSWLKLVLGDLTPVIGSALYAFKAQSPRWLRTLRHEVQSAFEYSHSRTQESKPTDQRRSARPLTDLNIASFSASPYAFTGALASEIFTRTLRRPVRVVPVNAFRYLLAKRILLPKNYVDHLNQLMDRRTRKDQHSYNTYFDILNMLFFQTQFLNTEWLILRIIKQTVFKLHRRNIKLKYLLRFIHNAILSLRHIGRDISLFRLVIHGKIKGGTHRTKAFTAGYGKPPLNSIGFNIRYCFDNIYSKYGEYGMHLLIGRRWMQVRA